MRKVTYADTSTKIQHLFGVDSLITLEISQITTGINKYSRLAWERAKWPEICPMEQRSTNGRVTSLDVTAGGSGYTSAPTVAFSGGGGTGAAATSLVTDGAVSGILVTSQGTGYVSAPTVTISGGGGSNATATAHVAWAVDYVSSGYDPIGEVFAVWGTDPYATAYPSELPFQLNANGALLTGKDDADPVWAHYRKRFVEYATDSEDIPYIFQQYLVHGTYADMLFAEGQHEKGNNALQLAEQLILNELDKLERQQSQENHLRVLTHVGQQSRI